MTEDATRQHAKKTPRNIKNFLQYNVSHCFLACRREQPFWHVDGTFGMSTRRIPSPMAQTSHGLPPGAPTAKCIRFPKECEDPILDSREMNMGFHKCLLRLSTFAYVFLFLGRSTSLPSQQAISVHDSNGAGIPQHYCKVNMHGIAWITLRIRSSNKKHQYDVVRFSMTSTILQRSQSQHNSQQRQCWVSIFGAGQWCQENGPGKTGTVLEACWKLAGTMLEPCWNPGGTFLEPSWNPGGTILEPVRTLLKLWLERQGTILEQHGGKRVACRFGARCFRFFRFPALFQCQTRWFFFKYWVGSLRARKGDDLLLGTFCWHLFLESRTSGALLNLFKTLPETC